MDADAAHRIYGGVFEPGRGTFVPFDPARGPNDRDLVMAPDVDGGVMDCSDKKVLKKWANLEHWKLKKVIRKRECIEHSLSSRFTENLVSV